MAEKRVIGRLRYLQFGASLADNTPRINPASCLHSQK